jgi:hypothetical protein
VALPFARRSKDYALTLSLAAGLSLVPGAFAYGHSSSQAAQAQERSSPVVDTEPPGSRVPAGASLAVGRVIYAELARTIEARKAKVGKRIEAKVTLAVLWHGKVLIANGAKISGHVTEVKRRSGKSPESVLGIVFDRAELKDGGELSLVLTVQAVGVGGFDTGRLTTGADVGMDDQYSAVAASPMPPGLSPRSSSPVSAAPSDLPQAAREPALDVGSKGVVGLSGLKLQEGTDPRKGSLVTSTSKDVKLDGGDELVLRVIAAKPESVAK